MKNYVQVILVSFSLLLMGCGSDSDENNPPIIVEPTNQNTNLDGPAAPQNNDIDNAQLNGGALFIGQWAGTVNQPNSGTYPAVMEFRLREDGSPEGEVNYPTLSCGGVYFYLGVEGDVQVFEENLTYGAQSDGGVCIDDGIVRIRVITENATDTLIWEWYSPDTGVLSSTAELLRE